MKARFKPVSRLTVIFIVVVIISGSLLTYFSINNIANLKELTEKKILEEEQRITAILQESILLYIQDLTTGFNTGHASSLKKNLFQKVIAKDSIVYPFIMDIQRNFSYPNFISISNNPINPEFSKQYNGTYKKGEVAEFSEENLPAAQNHYYLCLKLSRDRQDSVKTRNALGRVAVKMNDHEGILEHYQSVIYNYFSDLSENGIPYSYYAIQQLIQQGFAVDTKSISAAIVFFVEKMKNGLIPLTFSTEDLLNSIIEWTNTHTNQDTERRSKLEILSKDIMAQIEFINQYKRAIQNGTVDNIENNNITIINGFNVISSYSGEHSTLILIYADSKNPFGFVIKGRSLANTLLKTGIDRQNEFEYVTEFSESSNSIHNNTTLTYTSQFSPFFPDLRIHIRLKNENIIQEYVLKRSWIYGIAIILLLVSMMLGIFLILRDITREKHLASLRADFISNVTHELKTPLTSIYMFAESLFLGRVKTENQNREYLSVILKESERLKRMINNILEFSKIEKGKSEYHFSESNVTTLLQIVIDEMKYWFDVKQMKVITELKNNINMVIDPEKMKQVFSNLLSNAIKYSMDSTRIFVRLYQSDHKIIIEVEDEGIGIPEKELSHIFDKFYRVGQKETERISGTGLGLTAVKEIVNAHKGKVKVSSEPGKGSKFSIILNLNS